MYSQRGNLLFPVREFYVPKVGKIMPVGGLADQDLTIGKLLTDKGVLLKNKCHLLKDLTSFSEEVPVYGQSERF